MQRGHVRAGSDMPAVAGYSRLPARRVAHRHELLRRRRMEADGAVEIALVAPRLHRDGEPLRRSRRRPARAYGRRARGRVARSTTSFISVRSSRPRSVFFSGRNVPCRYRSSPAALAASSSVRPTVPISGCENTAVGMLRWSASVGLSRNSGLDEAHRLVDGDRRQLHPVGDVADRLDVVDVGARVVIDDDPPLRAELDAGLLQAEPSVLGIRPIAQHHLVDRRAPLPLGELRRSRPSSRFSSRSNTSWQTMLMPLRFHRLVQQAPQIRHRSAQELAAAIDQRRLDAEPVEDAGELDARCSRRRR